jgi:tRNA nucleotidyltransferase (CCA-adding enzyme)
MGSPVRAYMIRNVISASPDITMREIERLFFRHHIGHLPIVRNNALAGIVSRGDYLRGRMQPNFSGSRDSVTVEIRNAVEE